MCLQLERAVLPAGLVLVAGGAAVPPFLQASTSTRRQCDPFHPPASKKRSSPISSKRSSPISSVRRAACAHAACRAATCARRNGGRAPAQSREHSPHTPC